MIHFIDVKLLFGMIRLLDAIQVSIFESLASSVTINPCGSFYGNVTIALSDSFFSLVTCRLH